MARHDALLVGPNGAVLLPSAALLADGTSNPTLSQIEAFPTDYNGTTWDLHRGNQEQTLLANAARTATIETASIVNYNGRGVIISLRITANPGGAETLGIEVFQKDPVAGHDGKLVASFSALPAATNDDYRLVVYPGASTAPDNATQNKTYAQAIGRTYSVLIRHSAAGSWTYSLGVVHIL